MLQDLQKINRVSERELGPADALRWFNRHKIALLICTFIVAAVAAAFTLTLPRTYHAVAILRPVIPVESQSGLLNSAGALGGLTGTLLGTSLPANEAAVTLAYLRSSAFIRSFIEENGLLAEIYPGEWDRSQNHWRNTPPSLDDATKIFLNRLNIIEDRTGLVTLEVIWDSPTRAQFIAQHIIERINELRRERAQKKAKSNFDYLSDRLQKESIQEMRATIANMASRELTQMMLAQTPGEYALELIGAIYAPETPIGPRRWLIVIVGAVVGFSVCAIFLLARQALRST